MVLIYVERVTPRFSFIAKLIMQSLLGNELKVTQNKEEFIAHEGVKICYAKNSLESGVFIQPTNLLFESDISDQNPSKGEYHGDFVFFLTGVKSELTYDPFAASFFLTSRYEEYLPFIADGHNRFAAKESFAFKNKVLDKPLVNMYAKHIALVLMEKYPTFTPVYSQYNFTNSVDIDNPFAFKGKGLARTIGGFGKDLFGFNFKQALKRLKTVFGFCDDPFSTFDKQFELQEQLGFKTIYFALFSKLSEFDRSLSMQSPRLQRHLKSINDFCEVGIHPSYRSNQDPKIAEEELRSLEKVLNTNVRKSRQHFLKMKFPQTYRNLLDMDITDDYSMGYAEEAGFRAGICTPFRFYDLEYEVETPLVIHPFPFMDGTFIYYQKLSTKEAWLQIEKFIDLYKKNGGHFIPIWHYRIYSEKNEEWKGWNELFQKMVAKAV